MADGRTDFYIEPLRHIVSTVRTWLIYRDSFERCVGVFADLTEATRQAVRMAEYHVSLGENAQVHERPDAGSRWRTVWHAPGDEPRFPALPG